MMEFQQIKYLPYLMISVIFSDCQSQDFKKDEFYERRAKMVESQIIARGIRDKAVINAMLKVDRHIFVPTEYIHQAYEDYPLPIGDGQTISQPYIVALMTQSLDLSKSSRVLEIGTGSGYQAAILAEICDSVYTIELFTSLSKQAEKTLLKTGYKNIRLKTGDGYNGWKEFSPFDAIIVTCAPTHVPHALQEQLAEGGKMIIPVGEGDFQELILYVKKNSKIHAKSIVPVRFVPMIDKSGTKY